MYSTTSYKSLIILVAFILISGPSPVFAELTIIAHPSLEFEVVPEDIPRIFLGKLKQVDGHKVVPINLAPGNPVRQAFNADVLKKTDAQLKSYWSRLIFTGKAQPPQNVDSQTEMLELVARNPNLVGYIDSTRLSPEVKAIATFKSE